VRPEEDKKRKKNPNGKQEEERRNDERNHKQKNKKKRRRTTTKRRTRTKQEPRWPRPRTRSARANRPEARGLRRGGWWVAAGRKVVGRHLGARVSFWSHGRQACGVCCAANATLARAASRRQRQPRPARCCATRRREVSTRVTASSARPDVGRRDGTSPRSRFS